MPNSYFKYFCKLCTYFIIIIIDVVVVVVVIIAVGIRAALGCIPLSQTFFGFHSFIMRIIKSETFIKIDSLQHLEISRQAYLSNRSKIHAIIFTVLKIC